MTMRVKRGRTYTEICVFVGCFLLVFVSIAQILVFSHKARTSESSRTMVSRRVDEEPSMVTNKEVNSRKSRFLPGAQARIRARTRAQQEVRELEKSLAKLMRENSQTPEEANAKLQTQLYARRVGTIIEKAQKESLLPYGMKGSRLSGNWSHVGDDGDSSDLLSDKEGRDNEYRSVPYPAQKFGLPLSFQRNSSYPSQAIANADVIRKRKSRPLQHFKDFDNSEEYELKSILGQDYSEDNISRRYEENYDRIKKQFQDGTELYVNEEALKRDNPNGQDICPKEPDSLVGNNTEVNLTLSLDIEEIVRNNSDVLEGGEWKPQSCISRHRVAIIIPYRDRWTHLKVLLHYLIPTLKRQQIHFRIFVVEQYGNETFNKGRIMNAAFREALKLFDFECVTFHDVDLVPEDDRNMYSCTEQPKHMSFSIDKFQYLLPYQGLVGGVLMFRTEHFQQVNGYSNMYWGWGAEDDDMTTRILHQGLRVYRPPSNIARYKMVKHDPRKTSEVAVRMKLLRSAARRSKMEGLNNVQYKLIFTHKERLFTHFLVDIGHP